MIDPATLDPASLIGACLGSLCCLLAVVFVVGLLVWLTRRGKRQADPAAAEAAGARAADLLTEEVPRTAAPAAPPLAESASRPAGPVLAAPTPQPLAETALQPAARRDPPPPPDPSATEPHLASDLASSAPPLARPRNLAPPPPPALKRSLTLAPDAADDDATVLIPRSRPPRKLDEG